MLTFNILALTKVFFATIFLSCRKKFGKVQCNGSFCMRFHFSIKASFIVDTLIIRAGIVSGKATFLFLECCFLSGARTSSFCEFHLFSDGIFFQIVLVVSVHQASFF